MNSIQIENVETQLAQFTQPRQSMALEGISQAAMAWHKEQNDYENFMKDWRIYLLARRRTTELVIEEMKASNTRVSDTEYGFTKMQWSRRLKELAIPQPKLDAYFDELVSNGWQPSVNGLLRHVNGQELDRFANAIVEIRHAASILNQSPERMTQMQGMAVLRVLDAFVESETK